MYYAVKMNSGKRMNPRVKMNHEIRMNQSKNEPLSSNDF